MRSSRQSLWAWIAGPACALLGVMLVRSVVPLVAGKPGAGLMIVGYLSVPAGLAWFAACLGQRAVRRAAGSAAANDFSRTTASTDDTVD